jgi:replicative DNA helicase
VRGRDVADRENKVPNIFDGFGSSSIENYATALLTLYRHDYYVEQDKARPDERFPIGTAAVRIAKLRMRRNNAKKLYTLNYEGGIGFFSGDKT